MSKHTNFSGATTHTSAGVAYERLRDGLIWGRWKAGEKLKPQHLKDLFSTTSGVLREALIRLAGESFVIFEEQRGFSTLNPTRESFLELRSLRILLEKEGLTLSIQQGNLDWESNLVAAHGQLQLIERKMLNATDLSDFIRTWSRYDAQFHAALIANCRSDLLKKEHRRIYDLYRIHAIAELGTFGFRGKTTMDEHQAIVDSALERDTDACIKAVDQHVTIYRDQDNVKPPTSQSG